MSYVSRISVKLETIISIETERHPDQIFPEDFLKLLIIGNTADTLRQYRENDVGAAITEYKVISIVEEKKTKTCHRCGADLTKPEAISRLYTSKQVALSCSLCLGHYDKDGNFEPDTKPSIPLEHHDLIDGSDKCETCGAVVG